MTAKAVIIVSFLQLLCGLLKSLFESRLSCPPVVECESTNDGEKTVANCPRCPPDQQAYVAALEYSLLFWRFSFAIVETSSML